MCACCWRQAASAITATVAALVIGPSAEAAPNAGHFRLALDRAAQTADYTASADRNNYVILQGYQVPLMQRLKEQNPKLKVLVYKDLMALIEFGSRATRLVKLRR